MSITSLVILVLAMQPLMPLETARGLASSLWVTAEAEDDLHLDVAIAMQESSLLALDGDGPVDYGLFHFHIDTIIAYDLDAERLKGIADVTYQVKAYRKIMRKKRTYCKHLGVEAWSCFHSATPDHREKYVEDVSRHYRGKRIIRRADGHAN